MNKATHILVITALLFATTEAVADIGDLGVSYTACLAEHHIDDIDVDGFDDTCEYRIASEFRPLLTFYDAESADERHTHWAAFHDRNSQQLVVFYALAYERDNGATILDFYDHEGDTEFIILEIGYNTNNQRWRMNRARLSAHYGAPTQPAQYIFNHDDEALEFDADGRLVVHVAENKHANYPNRRACDAGAFFTDKCDTVAFQENVDVLEDRNMGSWAIQLVDEVYHNGDGDPLIELEAFWSDLIFCGWQFDNSRNNASRVNADCVPEDNIYIRQMRAEGLVPTCEHQCSLYGQTRCTDGNLQFCNVADSGCLTWEHFRTCNQGCEGIQCIEDFNGVSFIPSLPYPAGYSAAITQVFYEDYSHDENYTRHGIDFGPRPRGSDLPIVAIGDGVIGPVVRNCPNNDRDCGGGWGNNVVINHGNGEYSRYAHLQPGSIPDSIIEGTQACGGLRLGIAGATGAAEGVHLHFQFQDGPGVLASTLPFERFDGLDIPDVADPNTAIASTIPERDFCGPLQCVEPLGPPEDPELVGPGTYNSIALCGNQEEWFRMTVPANTRLDITLAFDHALGDLDATLYGADRITELDTSTSTTNRETLTLTTSLSREVFWKAYLYQDQGASNFTMTVTLTQLDGQAPIVATSSLTVSPGRGVVGQQLNASFQIRNRSVQALTLDRLVAGGRGPGGDADIVDFEHRLNVTLNPGQTYNYQGSLTPNRAGDYRFFIVYLADGQWIEPPAEELVITTRQIVVDPAPDNAWSVDAFCASSTNLQAQCATDFTRAQRPRAVLRLSGLQTVTTRVRWIYEDALTNQTIRDTTQTFSVNTSTLTFQDTSANLPTDAIYRLYAEVDNGVGSLERVPQTVGFTYGDVPFVEGRPYKGEDHPDVCLFTGGRCYILDSEPVYYHFFPGDLQFSQTVTIPQDQFDTITASAPCVIGGDFVDTPRGCILFDNQLPGDSLYFMRVRSQARRMTRSGAETCFDHGSIFAAPGIASIEFFDFVDTPGSPYHCDPDEPGQILDCGSCREQIRGCNPDTCLISTGQCESTCAINQECVNDACLARNRLIAGAITNPLANSVVSNVSFEIQWTLGRANNGASTRTALFCRYDGGQWDRVTGFGYSTSYTMTDRAPGTQVECKVRTRFDSDHETWIDSDSRRWTVASDYARMVVRTVTLRNNPLPNGCDDLFIDAAIRNTGNQEGAWRATAYLHPTGTDENDPRAIAAERYQHVRLVPNEERAYEFRFNTDGPLTLDPDAMEVTVTIEDLYNGFGQPSRLSAPAFVTDSTPPNIEDLEIIGYRGEPVEVLPGLTHNIRVYTRDNYAIERVELAWRQEGGQFEVLALDDGAQEQLNHSCTYDISFYNPWPIPENLGPDLTLELRLRVWDLAGLMDETTVQARTRLNAEPAVTFIAPQGGERYHGTDNFHSECVPVEFNVVPGVPITSMWVALASEDGSTEGNRTYIRPIPEDGFVSECLLTNKTGDAIRVVAGIEDNNSQEHNFYSSLFRIDFPPTRAPWSPQVLEPTQRPLPRPEFSSASTSVSYMNMRGTSNGRVIVFRNDHRWWRDNQVSEYYNERSLTKLAFSVTNFSLETSTSLLDAYTEHGRNFTPNDTAMSAVAQTDHFKQVRNETNEGCDNPYQEPCDYEVYYREVNNDVITQTDLVGSYPNRLGGEAPFERGFVLTPTDARLLALKSDLDGQLNTDLWRSTGGSWNRLATHPFSLRFLNVLDGTVRGIAREGDERKRMVAYQLNELTGQITNTTIAMDDLDDNAAWWAAKDIHEDTFYLLYFSYDSNTMSLASLRNGQWTRWPDVVLPDQWQGREIRAHYPSGLMVTGGQLLFQLQIAFSEGGYVDTLLRFEPGEAFNLDLDAFIGNSRNIIFEGRLAGLPDGRLIKITRCGWNFETRLCFQVAESGDTGCYDADPCTEDRWNDQGRVCQYVPVVCEQDDNACNGPEVCDPQSGQCVTDENLAPVCGNDLACDGIEQCDPPTGQCLPGQSPVLNDDVTCTADRCTEPDGNVVHTPQDDACSVGPCEIALCVPDDPNADPDSGCLVEARPIESDGLDCTQDTCDPRTGQAVHSLLSGSCVIDSRCVVAGSPNPDNPCQVCDPLRETHTWSSADEGQNCSDSEYCTTNDRCVQGRCQGQPRDCTGVIQDEACQRASCDEDQQRCVIQPFADGTGCPDEDLCNGYESCRQGHCQPGAPPELESNGPCIALVCDPIRGVTQIFTDAACDADEDGCTVRDSCEAGICVPGPQADCTEQDDACNVGGCRSIDATNFECVINSDAREGVSCNDEDSCTTEDRCDNGLCQGQSYNCESPGICELIIGARCLGDGTCAYDTAPDNTPCPDGFCRGGLCVERPAPCPEAETLEVDRPLVVAFDELPPYHALDTPCAPGLLTGQEIWLSLALEDDRIYRLSIVPEANSDVAMALHDSCDLTAECHRFSNEGQQGTIELFDSLTVSNDTTLILQIILVEGTVHPVEVVLEDMGPACEPGTQGCPCLDDETCGEGLVCANALCLEPDCEEGTENCSCYGNNTCNGDLNCEDGLCRQETCEEGTENCSCYGNNTCNDGLSCEGGLCRRENCEEGTEGCPCYGNNTCDEGLSCTDGLCVNTPVMPDAGMEDTSIDDAITDDVPDDPDAMAPDDASAMDVLDVSLPDMPEDNIPDTSNNNDGRSVVEARPNSGCAQSPGSPRYPTGNWWLLLGFFVWRHCRRQDSTIRR